MHIVIFGDQHMQSSGGAQVSIRLQKKYLERLGHTVTVVTPRSHNGHENVANEIGTPSVPLTWDREYAMTFPGRRTDSYIDREMARREPVDLVHVQADFWGAVSGYRFAKRHNLPIVHTMHNNVDVGTRATVPFAGLVLRAMNAWQRRLLGSPRKTRKDGWAYLAGIATEADAVTAPSTHFAQSLKQHGVFPDIDVIRNGIDDDVFQAPRQQKLPSKRPKFIWIGRISPEKRLMTFLRAIVLADIDIEVEIIGGGDELNRAKRCISRASCAAQVTFSGRLPYAETMRRLSQADALVQTSIGFETHGLTVFEAATFGVPVVMSDHKIAAELGSGTWDGGDGSVALLAEALRTAAQDITAGTTPQYATNAVAQFLQSERTAEMVELYTRVLNRN